MIKHKGAERKDFSYHTALGSILSLEAPGSWRSRGSCKTHVSLLALVSFFSLKAKEKTRKVTSVNVLMIKIWLQKMRTHNHSRKSSRTWVTRLAVLALRDAGMNMSNIQKENHVESSLSGVTAVFTFSPTRPGCPIMPRRPVGPWKSNRFL